MSLTEIQNTALGEKMGVANTFVWNKTATKTTVVATQPTSSVKATPLVTVPITTASKTTSFTDILTQKSGYVLVQNKGVTNVLPVTKATIGATSSFASNVTQLPISKTTGTVFTSNPVVAKDKVDVNYAVPKEITDFFKTSPFLWTTEQILNFWKIAIGSREDKITTAMDYVPANITITTPAGGITNKDMASYIGAIISAQKDMNASNQAFWETHVAGASNIEVNVPDIQFPDIFGGLKEMFANALPWLIAGGIGIVAILVLARKK